MNTATVDTTDAVTPPPDAAPPAQVEGEPDLSKLYVEVEDAAPQTPPEETEPAAEEPAAEAKPPPEVQDSAAKRIAAAKKAELRASEQRAKIRAREAELAKREAEIAKRDEEWKALQAKAKSSPTEALKAWGYDKPEEFLRQVIAEGTPEQAMRAEIELAKREAAAAREESRAAREAYEKAQSELQAQTKAQQLEGAKERFVEHVASKADAYPTLVEEFTDKEIAEQALQVVRQHGEKYFRETGQYLDDDVIAEHLETQAKARAEARTAWRQRVRGAQPGQGSIESVAKSGQGPTRPTAPRTMTAAAASTRATVPRLQTQEEIDAWSIKVLEGAIKP